MNIIFYRYNSICEPDYIEAFKKIGINVIEDKDGSNFQIDVQEKIMNLGEIIAREKPMFVFSINFFPLVSRVCDRIGVKYLTETVYCPVFEIYHSEIRNTCNNVFLFDYAQYLSVKNENPNGIFYLPLGAPVERVSSLLGNEKKYKYDISFVGSLYNEKDPFMNLKISEPSRITLQELMEKQILEEPCGINYIKENLLEKDIAELKRDGCSNPFVGTIENIDTFVAINNYLTYHMAYMERVRYLNKLAEEFGEGVVNIFTGSMSNELSCGVDLHDSVKTLTEMPFVFRQSKINLNITMRSIQTGIPQRVWDVMACRGFLLTNYQPELEEYFDVGTHLETFCSYEELKEKAMYYLSHDAEREKIAHNGYEEVKEKHSVVNRVMSMIRMVSTK